MHYHEFTQVTVDAKRPNARATSSDTPTPGKIVDQDVAMRPSTGIVEPDTDPSDPPELAGSGRRQEQGATRRNAASRKNFGKDGRWHPSDTHRPTETTPPNGGGYGPELAAADNP